MVTSTRSYGTSRRESHDASAFYNRRLATAAFSEDVALNEVPRRNLDRIYHHSSETMGELPDNSVALMVTSPPYHAGKDYDTDASYPEFLALLARVFAEVHRVLEPGGRAAVNVANLGRKPYLPLSHDVTRIMGELGFHMRGEVIWRKARGMASSCAFGTFASARNPVLRDVHEYVLVFSKGRMDRVRQGTSTITKEEFLAATLSVWDIAPASARSVGHPAPFPVALPRRLIELYTFAGDVVLDPFCGSGASAVAAVEAGRRFVGYDTDATYVVLARRRAREAKAAQAARSQDQNDSSSSSSKPASPSTAATKS
ncbi:MAG TPA: site-specific DNA-methyltransferase [Acidimicrobiales bacterium]|nr:site-specific DNA-methyltransferase [Acidimicrobiales bacterium]